MLNRNAFAILSLGVTFIFYGAYAHAAKSCKLAEKANSTISTPSWDESANPELFELTPMGNNSFATSVGYHSADRKHNHVLTALARYESNGSQSSLEYFGNYTAASAFAPSPAGGGVMVVERWTGKYFMLAQFDRNGQFQSLSTLPDVDSDSIGTPRFLNPNKLMLKFDDDLYFMNLTERSWCEGCAGVGDPALLPNGLLVSGNRKGSLLFVDPETMNLRDKRVSKVRFTTSPAANSDGAFVIGAKDGLYFFAEDGTLVHHAEGTDELLDPVATPSGDFMVSQCKQSYSCSLNTFSANGNLKKKIAMKGHTYVGKNSFHSDGWTIVAERREKASTVRLIDKGGNVLDSQDVPKWATIAPLALADGSAVASTSSLESPHLWFFDVNCK